MNKIMRMARALLTLMPRSHWGPFVEAAETTKFDHGFTVSWSQGGEDLALLSLFHGKKDGKYIDVGAHHPTRFSVTRHLYQLGWSGVNIEANSELMETFRKLRPRDQNVNRAVGTQATYEFTIFEEPAISTTDAGWRKKFIEEGQKIKRVINIEGITLHEILHEYFDSKTCDLLVVDAEGSDFDVIRSLELEKLLRTEKPKVILIENQYKLSEIGNSEIVKYILQNGYELEFYLPMSTVFKLIN